MFSRWISFGAIALGGCSASSRLESALGENNTAQPQIELAGDLKSSIFRVYSDDRSVGVGDLPDRAIDAKDGAFPAPPKSYTMNTLPGNLSEDYAPDGWETDTGEGFGMILTSPKKFGSERVVGAIYQIENGSDADIQKKLQYELRGMSALPAKRVEGPTTQYWFWTGENQIAMACIFKTSHGSNLTLAAGDQNVMRSLGISEEDAHTQIKQLARLDRAAPSSPPD